MPDLPTNLDATFPDDPEDPSVKEHQQYHDALATVVNLLNGDTPDAGSLLGLSQLAASGSWEDLSGVPEFKVFETALGVWTGDAPAGRANYQDNIELIGVTDPTDPTNGINSPGNIVAGDRWTQVTSFV